VVHLEQPINSSRREGVSRRVSTPVCDHVQDCTKLGRLTESSCSLAVHSIEQTGDAIKYCTVLWVIAHKVESQTREDDATVA
jgi:hypothetical protein